MTNTLINSSLGTFKQMSTPSAGASLKVIVFGVGRLNLGLRIDVVHKVLNLTQVHGSGLSGVGVAHMEDLELIVVDLQQRLFQSSILEERKHGYLIVTQNNLGEFYGIPVVVAPTLMEVPLVTIRVLPESYRHADTLGIASHVAVVPQAETSLTLFLLDVEQLLATS